VFVDVDPVSLNLDLGNIEVAITPRTKEILSVLSFHAIKMFNTFEGSAIVSPDAETKHYIDQLKSFGFEYEVTVTQTGINGRRYFYPLITEFAMYKPNGLSSIDRLHTAKRASEQVICLPMYSQLDSGSLIQIIKNFI